MVAIKARMIYIMLFLQAMEATMYGYQVEA